MDKTEYFANEENTLIENVGKIKSFDVYNEKIVAKPYFMKLKYKIDDKNDNEVYISEHNNPNFMELNILPWTSPIGGLKSHNVGESITKNKRNYTLLEKDELDIEISMLLGLNHIDADNSFEIRKSEILKEKEVERERKSYSLGSIVPTIFKEQDEVVRSEINNPLILMGPPGCGKTIIGAHRIVYILNELSEDFNIENTCVFVYNISLKNYLRTVFEELGIPELKVESIDKWSFHQIMDDIGEFQFAKQTDKIDTWMKTRPFLLDSIEKYISTMSGESDLLKLLNGYYLSGIFQKDYTEYAYSYTTPYNVDVKSFAEEQSKLFEQKQFSHHDVTLLLCIKYFLDLKFFDSLSHIFIDEAQDMSSIQLQLLYRLLDDKKSMTIAGDLNQQLYPDKSFSSWNDVFKDAKVRKSVLQYNHRMTYETAKFANAFMGLPQPDESEKRGELPVLKKTKALTHQLNSVVKLIKEIKDKEPDSSVAVLHYTNKMCEKVFDYLQDKGVKSRLAKRDTWEFDSTVNVSNYYQVKGLEFDYVFILGTEMALSDDTATEDLKHLYVAMSRTIKKLYIVYIGDLKPQLSKIDKSLYDPMFKV